MAEVQAENNQDGGWICGEESEADPEPANDDEAEADVDHRGGRPCLIFSSGHWYLCHAIGHTSSCLRSPGCMLSSSFKWCIFCMWTIIVPLAGMVLYSLVFPFSSPAHALPRLQASAATVLVHMCSLQALSMWSLRLPTYGLPRL